MTDIIYKYKNNLYLNITNRCPNNCEFCDIKKIGRALRVDLILDSEPGYEEIVKAIRENHDLELDEIVFCGGGEPLMRLDIVLQITKYIKQHHSQKVRLDTCGYPSTFYPDRNVAKELKMSGIDAVSISVNSTNKTAYNEICQPRIRDAFEKTLEFVQKCKKIGITTRITFVDYKIDRDKCREFANELKVDYYIRSYSPI